MILSGVTIGGTLLALAAIVVLAVVAASLHRSTSRLGDATECILLGDEARLALRRYARVQEPSLKREVDREIRRDIAAAYRYVDTPEERSSWEEARALSNEYLDDPSDDSPEHRARLGTALDAIEDFVSATATRARHDRVDASRWDTFASTIALSAGTCLLFASIDQNRT